MDLLVLLSLQYPILDVDGHEGKFHFRTTQTFPKPLLAYRDNDDISRVHRGKEGGCPQPELLREEQYLSTCGVHLWRPLVGALS